MTYTHNARAVLPAASDCGAVGNANYKRAGWMSATDQISKSLAAGLDSDCGNGHDLWASSMNTSLASGAVPMALADTALTRLCATACLTLSLLAGGCVSVYMCGWLTKTMSLLLMLR